MKKRPITIVLLLTVALCLGMIASGGPAFAAEKNDFQI